MQELINEILEYLFEGYVQNGGTSLFDITDIARRHNEDPHDIGRYLANRGWVKHQQYRPTSFVASISMEGIWQVRPGYITDNVMHVLRTLNTAPDRAFSIMGVMELNPHDFQIAHNFATYMKDRDLISAQFTHNDVRVQITMEGRSHLEG